jgi:hypothetical protein
VKCCVIYFSDEFYSIWVLKCNLYGIDGLFIYFCFEIYGVIIIFLINHLNNMREFIFFQIYFDYSFVDYLL